MVAVAGIVIGATSAYFSDTETSKDNTMAAGTMDLNVDGGNIAVKTMNLSDKAPGDFGTEIAILKNVGSLDGELDIVMGTVTNKACNSGGANDGTEYCDTTGTLGANAQMAPYIDVNQDGNYDDGTDIGLKSDGSIYVTGPLVYGAIDNYSGKTWNPSNNGVTTMLAGVEYDFVIDWNIPTGAGNEIQGDALDFDVTFTLEQADKDA